MISNALLAIIQLGICVSLTADIDLCIAVHEAGKRGSRRHGGNLSRVNDCKFVVRNWSISEIPGSSLAGAMPHLVTNPSPSTHLLQHDTLLDCIIVVTLVYWNTFFIDEYLQEDHRGQSKALWQALEDANTVVAGGNHIGLGYSGKRIIQR